MKKIQKILGLDTSSAKLFRVQNANIFVEQRCFSWTFLIDPLVWEKICIFRKTNVDYP